MKKLKPVMFVGTASDVGKSTISTGFCRIFLQDGYRPAPFKALNMSLNSFATPDGFEIGRAQAVQAEACGVACTADMNPVLLKPTNDRSSQVVLNGKPAGQQSALEYITGEDRLPLFGEAAAAFERLAGKYNPVVMEGAGSISELNLKHRDIANMRIAMHAGADVYLVADIERGGVFASVYGTIALLEEEERKCIRGIIVNKFRGDVKLFEPGKKILEDLTGIPVIGVVPYLEELHLEEEDSVALKNKNNKAAQEKVNIAVVLLRHLSNHTDFNMLERDPRVQLYYSREAAEIKKADIVILPGSKNTIADLMEIRDSGVAAAIMEMASVGKTVIGICGGFQMMGQKVEDPWHVEGDVESVPGLGLFPVTTTITREKVTEQRSFYYKNDPSLCRGYEIHMGISEVTGGEQPLNHFADGRGEGFLLHDKCWGTYIHGILDNQAVIENLLMPYSSEGTAHASGYHAFKEAQYDMLAAHLRRHADIAYVYENLHRSLSDAVQESN